MADTDKTVVYGVTADSSGFEKGMQQAAAAGQSFASDIDGHFKKVGEAFAGVQKQLLVLAGIVAGGAFFKEAIAASNALTGETLKLSKMLGITGEAASTLRTALNDIGSNGDDYVAVFTKFGRQVKNNEQGLKDMGIQTRESNGNLRDSKTVFDEALQKVGSYKAGLDQNIAAQTLFGKSIDDVMKFQKLNNEVIEEARKKNEALGLVISKDNVAAAKAYKLAMAGVDDMMLAIKKTVGDAVMPVFTELANYFASTGPYVVTGFKAAMLGLLTVFEVVKAAVTLVARSVFNAFNTIIESSALLGKAIVLFIKGDYAGAMNAGKELGLRLAQGVRNGVQDLADVGGGLIDGVKKNYNGLYGKKEALDAPKGGTNTVDDPAKNPANAKSNSALWEAQLAEAKLAYQEQNNLAGTFYQFNKQQELKFWQDKLALTVKGSADNLSVRRKLADLQIGINTEVFNHEIAALQAQEAAFKNNTVAKLALLDQEAELVKQRFGQESKEYEAVQKKIVEVKRLAVEQQKQIDVLRSQSVRDAAIAELQSREQVARLEIELGTITQQELLSKQRAFEEQKAAIYKEGLDARMLIAMTDPDKNRVEIERINQEILQLERQHQLALGEIRNQSVRESQRYTLDAINSMGSGFQRVFQQAMQGGLSLKGVFQGMWQSVTQAITGALAKIASEWMLTQLKTMVFGKVMAQSTIAQKAAEAGAGGVASMAAAPWPLDMTAPAFGAAMSVAALSFAPLASAAGGYDIPGTINPMVQAHANEMILPAKHADVIRNLADNDGQQGGGGPVNVNISAHPMPGNYFMVHRDHLIKALQSAQRDNAWKPA